MMYSAAEIASFINEIKELPSVKANPALDLFLEVKEMKLEMDGMGRQKLVVLTDTGAMADLFYKLKSAFRFTESQFEILWTGGGRFKTIEEHRRAFSK